MRKYFITILLAAGILGVTAQTVYEKPRSQVLSDSISQAEDVDEKLAIFHSEEAQSLMRDNPLSIVALGFPITQYYIDNADKQQAYPWLEKMSIFPQVYNSMWLSFYNVFAEKGEYAYIDDKLSPPMDSIYSILVDSTSISSETFGYYSRRLRYMVENKINLGDYAGALKHLDLVFTKFKNFNDTQNFYQYVQALAEAGRHEEAITVLATLYTNGTDFSPELRETKSWLIAKLPQGETLFDTEVEKIRDTQRDNFKQLLARSEELYGKDLKVEIGKSKYVLLSFWGTWCIPCIQTHPKLKGLYNQYKDHGLAILSLASENGKDSVAMENTLKASIEKQELDWLHTMLKGQNTAGHPYRKYNVQGYPTKILVDSEGVILGKFTGGSYDNDTNLQKLLAENMGDEETKARNIKISAAKIAFEDFELTEELARKENIYTDFIANQAISVAEVARLKDQMLESLITAYLAAGDREVAMGYYASIDDYIIKSAVALQLAEHLDSEADKLAILQENLDLYETSLPQENVNIYTQLAKAYLKYTPSSIQSAKVDRYLQTLFNSYGFFVSDVPSSTDTVPFRESLSYRLAKSPFAQANTRYLARVLTAYMSTDSLYQALLPEVLKEFAQVSGLPALLEAGRPKASLSGQLLRKTMLKEDINGIVQGQEAIADKYVLLDFWGSWCAPCRAGHPHLKELYEKYKDEGFEIVAVAHEGRGDLDVLIANWNTAVAADGLPWINLLSVDRERSGFNPVNDFHVQAFPTKILLDKQGNVIGRYGGDSSALDAKLKELFGI